MVIAVIDCGSGNLRSVAKALERAATMTARAPAITLTADPALVARASAVVLPGVGAFAACRQGLNSLTGMEDALREAVLSRAVPFLGICVGMQLMARRGLEHGSHQGLDWIAGTVEPIQPGPERLKVPHMGWNALSLAQPNHPLLAGIGEGAHAYFVHSFHFRPEDDNHVMAKTDYGDALVAMIGRDNMAGTQFHPEKSQAAGLRLLANFLAWRP
jgi:imidazole glycerol-phosphate synthase subunit HisH